MGLDYLSVARTPAMTIGAGRPWDVFFFVTEISTGASKGHFSRAYCSMLYAYRELGFACAKALLAQGLGLQGVTGAARFIVVRVAGQAAGAALLREHVDAEGTRVLLIDFLVVTPTARRHGIGRILVEHAQRLAPEGGVECFCAQESRAMQRLIKRLGFVRTQRSKTIIAQESKILLPSRWVWSRKG